jgi:polysaccharide export outer membrane protein
MNAKKLELYNPKSFFRWNRLIPLTVAGLYGTASTLSGTALLGVIDSGFLASAGVGQTLGDLPAATKDIGGRSLSHQTGVPPATLPPRQTIRDHQAQIPTLPPAETFDPNAPSLYYEPVPPLGYPQQPFEVSPPSQFNRYRLGIGDAIAGTVQRFPDLNFSGTIDLDGNILVPLLGKLQIAGLTVEGAQEKIRQGLNRFVVDPQLIVTLTGLRPAQVTITGEVRRPGYYGLAPGSQLLSALQAAGGATTSADLRKIVVRRRSPDGNSVIEQQVDLFTPLQNATNLPDLRLRDGDAVVVLELEVGTTQDYDRTLAARSTIAVPTLTIRLLSYPNGRIGNISLPNGSNFIDALTALAPSLDEANLREISLIRFDPEQGKAVTQKIDGKRALLGDISQNVPLQDEDVIVVGRTLIAKVNYALRLITRPFTDFLGFRSFFNNLTDVFGGDDNN